MHVTYIVNILIEQDSVIIICSKARLIIDGGFFAREFPSV